MEGNNEGEPQKAGNNKQGLAGRNTFALVFCFPEWEEVVPRFDSGGKSEQARRLLGLHGCEGLRL